MGLAVARACRRIVWHSKAIVAIRPNIPGLLRRGERASPGIVQKNSHNQRMVHCLSGSGWQGRIRRSILRGHLFTRAPMTPLDKTRSFLLVFLLGACFTIPAFSQKLPPRAASDAATSQDSPRMLTGKERLGRKWMDEQRIDNCNVPIDKRGSKTRPSVCHSAPTG